MKKVLILLILPVLFFTSCSGVEDKVYYDDPINGGNDYTYPDYSLGEDKVKDDENADWSEILWM